MLTNLTLAAVFAAFAQAATPAAAAQPISVLVEMAPPTSKDLQAWAGELRTALAARKDEFRTPKAGEKPELLVRLLALTPAPSGKAMLSWEVQRFRQTRPFSFMYSGPVKQQAEVLARNMRKLTDPMASAGSAPKK